MKPNRYVTTIVLTAAVTGLAAWYMMRGTVAENDAQAAPKPKPVTQSAPKPPKINSPTAEKPPRQLNAWGDFAFDEKEHEAMIKKWRAGELLPGEWHTHWAKLARADAANAIMLYAQLKLNDWEAERDTATMDILSKEIGHQFGSDGARLLMETFRGTTLPRALYRCAGAMPFDATSISSFVEQTKNVLNIDNLLSSVVEDRILENKLDWNGVKQCMEDIRRDGGDDATALSLLTAAIANMPNDKFENKMEVMVSELSNNNIPDNVAEKWLIFLSNRDPEGTFAYLIESKDSGIKKEQYSNVVRDAIGGWALQHPNAAATWLSQHQNDSNYDAMAAGLVSVIRNIDPTASDAWLDTIKDPHYKDWAQRTSKRLGSTPTGENIPFPEEMSH